MIARVNPDQRQLNQEHLNLFKKKIDSLQLQKCRCYSFIPQASIKCKNCSVLSDEHDPQVLKAYYEELMHRSNQKILAFKAKSTSTKCEKFTPVDDKTIQCGCNRLFQDHHVTVMKDFLERGCKPRQAKWDYNSCTTDNGLTDAFGDLLFLGVDKTAKYVKLSRHTKSKTILSILFSKSLWNLKQPGLIISVTGGTNLDTTASFKETFCKGLCKAALNTNAMITSGGMNMGCMKLVGEAFRESGIFLNQQNRMVTVLSIANWSTVRGNEALLNNNRDKFEDPAEYEMIQPKKSQNEKSSSLDPNHAYHILVDSAKLNEYGGEIELRTQIEKDISERGRKINGSMTPIVVIVLGGGRGTVKTVLQSVMKGLPCVFFGDTGKFSNVFAFIQNKIDNKEPIFVDRQIGNDEIFKDFNDAFMEVVKEKIIYEMAKDTIKTQFFATDEIIKPILSDIEKIFQPKYQHLLSFFKLNPSMQDNSVDVAILNALLKKFKQPSITMNVDNKSAKGNEKDMKGFCYRSQVELCLKWNRFDLAKKFILSDKNKDNIGSVDEFMYYSIENNRHEFVKLFLENGFVVKNFLTYRKLLKLYNDIPKTCDFHVLLNRVAKEERESNAENTAIFKHIVNKSQIKKTKYTGKTFSYKNIGRAIELLIDYFYTHKFCMLPFSHLEQAQCQAILEESPLEKTIGIFNGLDKSTEFNVDKKCDHPENELFVYSVLMGWKDLALVFWRAGNNKICSALFASKIFKKFGEHFDEKRTEYFKMANEFENLAFRIINLCNDQDQKKVQRLLIKEVPEYGDKTALQIAISASDFEFISHISCQSLLTKLWYNRIMIDTPKHKLYLSLMLPMCAPFLVDFDQRKKNLLDDENEEEDDHTNGLNCESENESDLDQSNYHRTNGIKAPSNIIDMARDDNDPNKKATILHLRPTKMARFEQILVEYFNLMYFFCKAPFTKFFYHQIFYLMFLFLFSYVMMCNFYEINKDKDYSSALGLAISIPEVVVIIWVLTFLLEEFRKFSTNETKILKAKFKSYLFQNWNFIGVISIILFLIGMILRFIPNYRCFLAARVILSINVLFWYVKMLQAYWFLRALGPMLVLIERMVIQLAYFMLILALFIFSFGVSTQALMYPNQKLDKELLKNIFFPSFFIFNKEYYTRKDIMDADYCMPKSNFSDIFPYSRKDCPDNPGADVSLAIYVIYMVLMNLLLVNLLIAIFNNKFTKIHQNASKMWKYQRYLLVHEYFFKPMFPGPFEIVSFINLSVKKLLRLCLSDWFNNINTTTNQMKLALFEYCRPVKFGFVSKIENQDDEYALSKWESFSAEEILEKLQNESATLEDANEKLKQIDLKFTFLNEKFQSIDKKLDRLWQSNKSSGVNSSSVEFSRQTSLFEPSTPKPSSLFTNKFDFFKSKPPLALVEKPIEEEQDAEQMQAPHLVQAKKDLVEYAEQKAFTSKHILLNHLADPEILPNRASKTLFKFNEYDTNYNVDRRSCSGSYEIINGLPECPLMGTKNLKGRGSLFYYGPNHAILAVVTKFSKTLLNEAKHKSKLQVLVNILDTSSRYFKLPHVFNENIEFFHEGLVDQLAAKVFNKDVYARIKNKNMKLYDELVKIVKSPLKLCKYIPNHSLNMNNAWIEYTAMNYHDANGNVLDNFELSNVKNYKWIDIDVLINEMSTDYQTHKVLKQVSANEAFA